MFIKRGEGKILTVIDSEDLDKKSKKAAQELAQQPSVEAKPKSEESEK
jgi:hypothetical protein